MHAGGRRAAREFPHTQNPRRRRRGNSRRPKAGGVRSPRGMRMRLRRWNRGTGIASGCPRARGQSTCRNVNRQHDNYNRKSSTDGVSFTDRSWGSKQAHRATHRLRVHCPAVSKSLENGRYRHAPIRSDTSIRVYTTADTDTDTSTPCVGVPATCNIRPGKSLREGRYNSSRYDSIRYTQYRFQYDTDPIIVRSLIVTLLISTGSVVDR